MKQKIAAKLWVVLMNNVALTRDPDFVVGANNPGGAYLNRWYLTPWRNAQTRLRNKAASDPSWWNRFVAWGANKLPNLYLHEFLRDDEDRALHDHPSWAVSFILRRGYVEHTIANGGIHNREAFDAGSLRYLPTTHAHRVELKRDENGTPLPCWSLFMFGPLIRQWGFHCPQRGWVHWTEFTAAGNPGEVGRGCE